MKHLVLEIVEATEAAALAASRYVGSGDKLAIDKAATDAMRARLNLVEMNGRVVIGEGKKDESFGLYQGESVGVNRVEEPLPHDYDLAVDPVDGTTQTAKGGYEAISVIAVGGRDCLLATEVFYMDKIAVGKLVAEKIHISLKTPIEQTVDVLRLALGKRQITACMLERPRHEQLAARLRARGCRIKFIQDCDVSGAIAAALPDSGIDLFVGIGGAPEGVIAAAALKCLGGYFEGCLVDYKTHVPIDDKVYTPEMLAKGDVLFAATGITAGSLLKGVRHQRNTIVANSILMESSTRSVKFLESYYGIEDGADRKSPYF
jgi:fructose-1,6-bisphosphatase class II